jgi:superfamily II DNA or RNA helicase
MNYADFIAAKRHSLGNSGFDPVYMPDSAFDFQRAIIERAVNKGRYATFADTGLGKTLIELSIAQNVVQKTNRPALILTPLAVAFQFLGEAERIGIKE